DRHIVAGYTMPAMGVALMMPITLHLLFALVLDGAIAGFDAWCLYSVIFVGVAHVAFAVMVGRRAAAIVRVQEPMKVDSIYIATVALAGIPGVVLVLPMLLVAITGVPMA